MANTKDEPEEVTFSISTRTIIKVLALTIATIILLAAVRKAAHALLLIFTAIFLALALNAPVAWMARRIPGKRRGSRVLGTVASFLLIVIVLGSFMASIVPPIVRQTKTLVDTAPQIVRDARNKDGEIGKFITKYNLESQVEKFSSDLSGRLNNASGSAVSTLGKIGSSIFATLTVLALTFMRLVEGPKWVQLGLELTPHKKRAHTKKLLGDMYRVIKGYVNGQVLLAAIASAILLPGLIIFDVSYPIALLGIVFICGLIPMVGHTIGAVIVTIVALFTSPLSALGILAYYILYQQIENYLIQPRLQANSTNMSPLLVFSSVVIGVSFSGLFGGLVAIPIAGCLRILVLDQLQRRNLLDKPVVEQEVSAAAAGTK
jgi:predicted PurR-regulated permease PerM